MGGWGQRVHRLPYLPTDWLEGRSVQACVPVDAEGLRWELQVASLCRGLPGWGRRATQLCCGHRAGEEGQQAQFQAAILGKRGVGEGAEGAAALWETPGAEAPGGGVRWLDSG